MSVFEDIRKKLTETKDERVAKQAKEEMEKTYKEMISDPLVDNATEETAKAIANNLLQEIKDGKKTMDDVTTYLNEILDSKVINDKVYVSVAKKLGRSDLIDNKVIVDSLVENDVPNKVVSDFMEDDKIEFSPKQNVRLLYSINNPKIRIKNIKKELDKFYEEDFEDKNYSEVKEKLLPLYGALNGEKNEEIDELCRKIVAKHMAANYHQFGYTKIKEYSELPFLQLKDMKKYNLPNTVFIEYMKAYPGEKNKVDINNMNMRIDKAYTEKMKKKRTIDDVMSGYNKEKFIDTLAKLVDSGLMEDFIKYDDKLIDTLSKTKKIGLIDNLMKFDNQKREQITETVSSVVKKQLEKETIKNSINDNTQEKENKINHDNDEIGD